MNQDINIRVNKDRFTVYNDFSSFSLLSDGTFLYRDVDGKTRHMTIDPWTCSVVYLDDVLEDEEV